VALSNLDVARYCDLVRTGKLRTEAAAELEIPYSEIAKRRRLDRAFADQEKVAMEESDELQLGVVRKEIKARMLDRADKESGRLLAKEAMRLDPLYNERRSPEGEKAKGGIQIVVAGMIEPRVQIREVGDGADGEVVEELPAARPAGALPP